MLFACVEILLLCSTHLLILSAVAIVCVRVDVVMESIMYVDIGAVEAVKEGTD